MLRTVILGANIVFVVYPTHIWVRCTAQHSTHTFCTCVPLYGAHVSLALVISKVDQALGMMNLYCMPQQPTKWTKNSNNASTIQMNAFGFLLNGKMLFQLVFDEISLTFAPSWTNFRNYGYSEFIDFNVMHRTIGRFLDSFHLWFLSGMFDCKLNEKLAKIVDDIRIRHQKDDHEFGEFIFRLMFPFWVCKTQCTVTLHCVKSTTFVHMHIAYLPNVHFKNHPKKGLKWQKTFENSNRIYLVDSVGRKCDISFKHFLIAFGQLCQPILRFLSHFIQLIVFVVSSNGNSL